MIGRFLCAAALMTASVTIVLADDASDGQAKVTLVCHHLRRMAPPLTSKSLILHRRYARELTAGTS